MHCLKGKYIVLKIKYLRERSTGTKHYRTAVKCGVFYRTAIKSTKQYLNDIKGLSTCALAELVDGLSKSHTKNTFPILIKKDTYTHTYTCIYMHIYVGGVVLCV